jgi:ribosomal protein L29
MAEKKSKENSEKKLKDLKIELLKNSTKRKSIKKEIARILTAKSEEKE